VIYYAVRHYDTRELLAIGKGPRTIQCPESGIITQETKMAINEALNDGVSWYWDTTLTPAEFDTLQAFGITEIKYEDT